MLVHYTFGFRHGGNKLYGSSKPENKFGTVLLADFSAKVHRGLIFLAVVNMFLSIAAFLGNTLILAALFRESSLRPPSKFLHRNLAIRELLVGVIVELMYVAYLVSVVNKRHGFVSMHV